MRAVGQDMEVARDAGVNVERTGVISMVISTVFAGFGMIIYLQNVGNFPTYTAPTQMRYVLPSRLCWWAVPLWIGRASATYFWA